MTVKKIAFAVACALAAFTAGAAEEFPKPRDSETILVGRVVVLPAIEDSFYSKYTTISSRTIKIKNDKSADPAETVPSQINIYGKLSLTSPGMAAGRVGEMFTVKVGTPKNRVLRLYGFSAYLGGSPLLNLFLPHYSETTLPEGKNYVYLGTFVYERSGERFELIGSKIVDEFDEAQKLVSQRYGADAKLVRVPPYTMLDPSTLN